MSISYGVCSQGSTLLPKVRNGFNKKQFFVLDWAIFYFLEYSRSSWLVWRTKMIKGIHGNMAVGLQRWWSGFCLSFLCSSFLMWSSQYMVSVIFSNFSFELVMILMIKLAYILTDKIICTYPLAQELYQSLVRDCFYWFKWSCYWTLHTRGMMHGSRKMNRNGC